MIEILTTPDANQQYEAIQLASTEIDQPSRPDDTLNSLRQMYTNLRDAELWVVLVDSAIRGMIAFHADTYTSSAKLEVIATDPESRRLELGIGRTLVEAFETEMRRRSIDLITLQSVGSAIGFYEKLDYTRDTSDTFYKSLW